ncbi:hypothetical protein HDU98_003908 [Podochytrium sp. JEL0797]|nr:hypothetical protein HDU98_003908 [Podochytrium sp. JEL0797]
MPSLSDALVRKPVYVKIPSKNKSIILILALLAICGALYVSLITQCMYQSSTFDPSCDPTVLLPNSVVAVQSRVNNATATATIGTGVMYSNQDLSACNVTAITVQSQEPDGHLGGIKNFTTTFDCHLLNTAFKFQVSSPDYRLEHFGVPFHGVPFLNLSDTIFEFGNALYSTVTLNHTRSAPAVPGKRDTTEPNLAILLSVPTDFAKWGCPDYYMGALGDTLVSSHGSLPFGNLGDMLLNSPNVTVYGFLYQWSATQVKYLTGLQIDVSFSSGKRYDECFMIDPSHIFGSQLQQALQHQINTNPINLAVSYTCHNCLLQPTTLNVAVALKIFTQVSNLTKDIFMVLIAIFAYKVNDEYQSLLKKSLEGDDESSMEEFGSQHGFVVKKVNGSKVGNRGAVELKEIQGGRNEVVV